MKENKCKHLKPERLEELHYTDAFNIMYERQKDLQDRYGLLKEYENYDMRQKCERAIYSLYCFNAEMAEMFDRLPFKKWKKYSEDELKDWKNDEQRIETLFEFVDAFHFLLDIMIVMGITPEEVFSYYLKKNEENFKRQDRGY